MGAWHIYWQDLIDPDFVEVVMGQHRADIVGNDGTVVELQHSNISVEDISARESFYGKLIWLFDATERFAVLWSRSLAFFTLNRTEHLLRCQKPVFLDFGSVVVEVTQFTKDVPFFHGYGQIRSHEWFAQEYLSEVLSPSAKVRKVIADAYGIKGEFVGKKSIDYSPHRVNWIKPNNGETVESKVAVPIVCLNYEWTNQRSMDGRPVWIDIIDKHPKIARGWDTSSFRRLLGFFGGKPLILNGGVTMLPSPPEKVVIDMPVSSVERLLSETDEHIKEGRFPVLKELTRKRLIEKAEEYEVKTYGKRLVKPTEQPAQKLWFED